MEKFNRKCLNDISFSAAVSLGIYDTLLRISIMLKQLSLFLFCFFVFFFFFFLFFLFFFIAFICFFYTTNINLKQKYEKNECHSILSDKPIVIPIPVKSLLPDIHSCTNRCSPYVILDSAIEDLVELNQNNDDGLAY